MSETATAPAKKIADMTAEDVRRIRSNYTLTEVLEYCVAAQRNGHTSYDFDADRLTVAVRDALIDRDFDVILDFDGDNASVSWGDHE